jgi:hypothetical protein
VAFSTIALPWSAKMSEAILDIFCAVSKDVTIQSAARKTVKETIKRVFKDCLFFTAFLLLNAGKK